jgi:hypothetical protein
VSGNSGSQGAWSGFDSIPMDYTAGERAWQANYTWDLDQPLPSAKDDDETPRPARRQSTS